MDEFQLPTPRSIAPAGTQPESGPFDDLDFTDDGNNHNPMGYHGGARHSQPRHGGREADEADTWELDYRRQASEGWGYSGNIPADGHPSVPRILSPDPTLDPKWLTVRLFWGWMGFPNFPQHPGMALGRRGRGYRLLFYAPHPRTIRAARHENDAIPTFAFSPHPICPHFVPHLSKKKSLPTYCHLLSLPSGWLVRFGSRPFPSAKSAPLSVLETHYHRDVLPALSSKSRLDVVNLRSNVARTASERVARRREPRSVVSAGAVQVVCLTCQACI
jgi:hypothetical protein